MGKFPNGVFSLTFHPHYVYFEGFNYKVKYLWAGKGEETANHGGEINMVNTFSKLPLRAHKKIWMVFVVMLTVFVCLTIANEILDLPHYIFGDEPTT